MNAAIFKIAKHAKFYFMFLVNCTESTQISIKYTPVQYVSSL